MHWLKRLVKHWLFRDKTWHVGIQPFAWADSRAVFIDLLEDALRRYPIVSISQQVDAEQWNIGDREQFVDHLRGRFSVHAMITSDYVMLDSPQVEEPFVIHTAGSFSRGLLEDLAHFGMVSLPNIIYGLQVMPDNWTEPGDQMEQDNREMVPIGGKRCCAWGGGQCSTLFVLHG